jgi:hypothetical protein
MNQRPDVPSILFHFVYATRRAPVPWKQRHAFNFQIAHHANSGSIHVTNIVCRQKDIFKYRSAVMDASHSPLEPVTWTQLETFHTFSTTNQEIHLSWSRPSVKKTRDVVPVQSSVGGSTFQNPPFSSPSSYTVLVSFPRHRFPYLVRSYTCCHCGSGTSSRQETFFFVQVLRRPSC